MSMCVPLTWSMQTWQAMTQERNFWNVQGILGPGKRIYRSFRWHVKSIWNGVKEDLSGKWLRSSFL